MKRSLFSELERRNVIRAAVLYVGAVWALTQGIAQLAPVVGAPDWVARWFLVACVIGFPLWIAFAWFYEFTPEGLKRESEIDPARSVRTRASRKMDRWIFAVMGLAIVLLLTDRFVLRHGVNEEAASPVPDQSIAVLPFTDLSQARDQAYFSDGISEELLNLLAKVPQLQVTARTSSFYFKGKDTKIPEIARQLHVAHILEGSVQKAGDRVRITVQLVDASSNTQRWSQSWDRKFDDIFKIQDEIAGEVVKELKVKLLGAAPKARASDPNAYALFLRGRFFYNRRAPGDIERARKLYEQALEIDTGLARAWAGLAAIYSLQQHALRAHTADDPEPAADDDREHDMGERQGEAVKQALRLAPNLAEVQIRAARYEGDIGNWDKSVEHFERARALDPDHPLVLGTMASAYLYGNRLDEAIAATRRALVRDPLSAVTRTNLATLLQDANHLDEAMTEYRKVLPLGHAMAHGAGRVDGAVRGIGEVLLLQRQPAEALEWIESWPAGPDRDRGLAMAYHALGRPVEADAALGRLVASAGASDPLDVAEVYAYRGDFDDALAWLQRLGHYANCRRDGEQRIFQQFYSPFLARMRGDPRWDAWRSNTARTMQACDFVR